MATAGHTGGNSGIIQPPHRSARRVALDLWRAGGSFRGFVEFALIGSVILAFLPGHKDFGAASFLRSLVQNQPSNSATAPNKPSSGKLAKPSTDPELPLQKRSTAIVPRLSDLKIASSYFDGIEEPLHEHLVAALAAYNAQSFQKTNEALSNDDPEDRHVLLLRGLAALGLPGPEATATGVGMLERAVAKGEARAAAILGVFKMTGLVGYSRDPAAGREMLERAVAGGDAAAAHVLGDGFISGWAGSIDPERAERYLRLASDRGDVDGTVRLAEMLYMGQGVAKNQAEGERLFLKAANVGHARAQAMMGALRLMPYSAGLTESPDEALDWFERGAAQNDAHAMFYLGLFYMEYGERIGRLDPSRAFNLFRTCSEKTLDHQCLFAYATAYDLGIGTTPDPVMAYALYSLAATRETDVKAKGRRDEVGKSLSAEEKARANTFATQFVRKKNDSFPLVQAKFKPVETGDATRYRADADKGNARAQYNLGRVLKKGLGVTKDQAEAVNWFRLAADQGFALAQVELGLAYEEGQGVGQDYAEAAKWYRKAADQGNVLAYFNIGLAYEKGRGVPQDYAEAVNWYRRAAEKGNALAQNNLGAMYTRGLGVAQDYAEAVNWYRRAAEQGQAFAQINLGNNYVTGSGVPQDYKEAAKWYRKAADQGNALAQARLKAISPDAGAH